MTATISGDFARRTRRLIHLPLKDAFNGSLLRLGDDYLMFYNSFNEQGYENRRTSRFVHACFLDSKFRCRESGDQPFLVEDEGDIRIFEYRDKTYVQSIAKRYDASPKYQIVVREVRVDGETIINTRSFPIRSVDGMSRDEKNWGFFSHGDELYAVRRIVPHQIVKVDLQGGQATTAYDVPWKPDRALYRTRKSSLYRGNVTPILDRGVYLSMFHTRVSRKRLFWGAENVDFLTGFYTFSSKPPFQVIAYTEPFFNPGDIEPLLREYGSEKIRCIFPVSLSINNNELIVSGGENDIRQCIWTFDLDDVHRRMMAV